jgi:uncharacterized membrane protein
MAFCASCGSPVDGKFCAQCGAPVSGGAAASSAPGSQPGVGYQPPGSSHSGYPASAAAPAGLSENAASALCYLLGLITGIIFLVMAPYNQNRSIRFHAFQSIFLNLAWIVTWVALNIVFGFLHIFGLFLLSPLIGLGFFLIWLYMLIVTYQGKKVVLPIIGSLAQQQA